MVWYSHLCKNFPQFVVIHTVKGFSIVDEEVVNVFLELSCFFYDPNDVGSLISGSSDFSKCRTSGSSLLKLGLKNIEHYFAKITWTTALSNSM